MGKVVQQKWFVIVAMAVMLCLAGLVISGTAFAQQCVDNGDGTVTDNSAGLMWQKASGDRMNWYAAMSYASGLSFAGHSDWRLPSRDRLQELFYSPCQRMIELAFPAYWSSTTLADNTNSAWRVHLKNGSVAGVNKSGTYHVRAVRSVQ
ncbi:DUF1566 domain-containing protein [Desulfonatronovibrio magnus]|uniref:Lcl C-terminal domain-containing protein n=1 Tax=Desulfonatronovibrio magnus TaxID=698827 RepID=UPI000697848C|nr:DUF1566 domain-containing protein [Desulfonatronovibrio magnus]